MEKLLTISEFAKLRNININSLRYYERIGILKPQTVDKTNGYRYYSLSQLQLIDAIFICTDCGIPLKEFACFMNNDSSFETRKLLEYGKQRVESQIMNLQNMLERIRQVLDYMDKNKSHFGQTDFFEKYIPERHVLIEKIDPCYFPDSNMEAAFAAIYKKGEQQHLYPFFPMGLLIQFTKGHIDTMYMYLNYVGNAENSDDVRIIPSGNYKCIQVKSYAGMDILKKVNDLYGKITDSCVLVENAFSEKDTSDAVYSEIQVLLS